MDKYTKAVLTVIALCVVALPVKAEEKVYYCRTTGYSDVSVDGITEYKPENFKFKVTPTEIVFGSGGFFNKERKEIKNFSNFNLFTTYDEWSILAFYDGVFSYGIVLLGNKLIAMTARCDDF